MADDPPYWVLISILFSTQPLTPTLAHLLHEAAYQLYRTDEARAPLDGELIQGEVRNLRKAVAMGSITGPGFEAEFDNERGHGRVAFLLTEQGIERMAEARKPAAAN